MIRRPLSDHEWQELQQVLIDLDNNPEGDAILDRCVEQGATIQTLIAELRKRPSLQEGSSVAPKQKSQR